MNVNNAVIRLGTELCQHTLQSWQNKDVSLSAVRRRALHLRLPPGNEALARSDSLHEPKEHDRIYSIHFVKGECAQSTTVL